jgi:hypothetical protein
MFVSLYIAGCIVDVGTVNKAEPSLSSKICGNSLAERVYVPDKTSLKTEKLSTQTAGKPHLVKVNSVENNTFFGQYTSVE